MCGQNLTFPMLEAELFPRKLASNFRFFVFGIPFYVGSGFKSGYGAGTEITVPVPLKQNVAIPALVPQHWLSSGLVMTCFFVLRLGKKTQRLRWPHL